VVVESLQASFDYFRYPKYVGAEILFGSLGKPHFLLADTHVLPNMKRRFREANAPSPGLHSLPYSEYVRIGDSRGRYFSRRVNRVIVRLDKFRQNINISVRIFICKIFIESIANRAMHTFQDRRFQVGVSAHVILNVPSFCNMP